MEDARPDPAACGLLRQAPFAENTTSRIRSSLFGLGTLHYLLASAEAGNFGLAAKSLGVRTSTVSRRIAQIEDELGVTLFERGHFGIRLTAAGREVMVHVRRVFADLDAVRASGHNNGSGIVGQIHVGVRLPPVGTPIQPLLDCWHRGHPNINLVFHETNERDIRTAIEDRRLDIAFMTQHTLWPRAVAEPIYRERILLAIPKSHPLVNEEKLMWEKLRHETFLVQGWDESQTAREFYASFLGSGVQFKTHAASKQTIMALVGASFGVTLVTESQAEVRFPGVVYKPIAEKNAMLQVELVWAPQNKEAVVGRFIAFIRDEARSRRLL